MYIVYGSRNPELKGLLGSDQIFDVLSYFTELNISLFDMKDKRYKTKSLSPFFFLSTIEKILQ